MLDDVQRRELAKPLDRATVKTREQSGRKLSYIEGWHAIAEANRIFGFDGWSRETIDIRCVAEGPRQIGKTNPQPGHGVSYIAKVRVNVGGIVRDGCGTGHGIDRDLGQAHESALKEAETDAMKRALMTFGNPFGLALYDKTQADVVAVLTKKDARPTYLAMLKELDRLTKVPELQTWLTFSKDAAMRPLPDDWQANLVKVVEIKISEIRGGHEPPLAAEILSDQWAAKQSQNLVNATQAHSPDDEDQIEWTDDTPPEWDSAWEKIGPVKQAGTLCGDAAFWKFLTQRHRTCNDADTCASAVRWLCGVASRKELATNDEAAKKWRALVADYRAWQRTPEIDQPQRQPGVRDAADQPPAAEAPQRAAPAGGEVPSAQDYTARWTGILDAAVPSRRAQIAKAWNDEKALRGAMVWTDEHSFSALKKRVNAVLDVLKEEAGA